LFRHCPHGNQAFALNDERLQGEDAVGIRERITAAERDHRSDGERASARPVFSPRKLAAAIA
jgi:hypothetical protein